MEDQQEHIIPEKFDYGGVQKPLNGAAHADCSNVTKVQVGTLIKKTPTAWFFEEPRTPSDGWELTGINSGSGLLL